MRLIDGVTVQKMVLAGEIQPKTKRFPENLVQMFGVIHKNKCFSPCDYLPGGCQGSRILTARSRVGSMLELPQPLPPKAKTTLDFVLEWLSLWL
jgi:hypothetical protein